jgi:RNA polymerase sigma factor (sigma-70 family)
MSIFPQILPKARENLSDSWRRGYYMVEMQTKSDADLLREYADNGVEAAFAEIVARHTNLVYSAALRQVNSPDIAAEVAQRVFIGLAQGARSLSRRFARDASLAGWLCRSARNISLNHRRDEFRRRSREGLAMENLNATSDSAPEWEKMRPVLDDAMSDLDESDYDAIVMRFFRNQDFRTVGVALGVSDDTAQKRVSRALEKLRGHLSQRGVTTTAAALSIVLSAKAVQVAPAGLAAGISSAAMLAQGAANTSTAIAVTKGILMTTFQKALVAAALAGAVGTGIFEARRASALQERTAALTAEYDSLTRQMQEEREEASRKLAAAQRKNAPAPGQLSELMKLRAKVDRLQDQLANAKAAQQDPSALEISAWMDRVKKLKEKLARAPERAIPEFQLLTDQDWLDAVRDVKQLETDADYDKALDQLKNAAKREFSTSVQSAIQAYAQANNGALPGDFSQLQPYFATAPDDSILQGYQFTQPGTVASKTPSLIDQNGNYYSSQLTIGMDSISSSTTSEDALHQAIQSYLAANNGQTLTDPAQLLPYVTTPEEKTALQKILQGNSGR